MYSLERHVLDTVMNKIDPSFKRNVRLPQLSDTLIQRFRRIPAIHRLFRPLPEHVLVESFRHQWSVSIVHRPHRSYDGSESSEQHACGKVDGFIGSRLVACSGVAGGEEGNLGVRKTIRDDV